VTEPIEFTFMFLAPVLYALHALLTGAAMVIMSLLDSHLGFTFSAGLFDYVINYGQATRPWILLPVGLAYGVVYYGLFRLFIGVFNLQTPGREADSDPSSSGTTASPISATGRAPAYVAALGGAGNLRTIAACTTRLRVVVNDRARVDEAALRGLGAKGVIYPSPNDVQVIVGPVADAIADELRAHVSTAPASAPPTDQAQPLGGRTNILAMEVRGSRLCLTLADSSRVDPAALHEAFPRGWTFTGVNGLHAIVGPDAARVASALSA